MYFRWIDREFYPFERMFTTRARKAKRRESRAEPSKYFALNKYLVDWQAGWRVFCFDLEEFALDLGEKRCIEFTPHYSGRLAHTRM